MSYIPYSRADLAGALPYQISSDHTTKGSEILKCIADCTVYLNLNPKDRETVLIKLATANTVNIVGDININSSAAFYNTAEYSTGEFGQTNITVDVEDTTVIFMYIREFGEWFPYN